MSEADDWFYEAAVGGLRHGVKVRACLLDQRTEFQHIQVFETEAFGRMMVLDGYIQTTERDEYLYHQILVHAALARLRRPAEHVLIIGGGDGGSLREVLRHPVRQAVLAELDGGVIEAARTWLPSLHQGAFDDPRTDIRTGDGFEFVRESGPVFDAILVDATDPDGPGAVLYSQDFYKACRNALTPGGVIGLHLGLPFHQQSSARHGWNNLSAVFEAPVALARAVPSYGGGNMLFAFATPAEGGAGVNLSEPVDTLFWPEPEDTAAHLLGRFELEQLMQA